MAKLSNLNRRLSLFTLLLALAALTIGTANISWADSLNEEMRNFNHFLSEHPRIAADLQRNPSLANNWGYLHAHDNLRDFLHNHPKVRRQLTANRGYALGAPYGVYPPYASRPYESYRPYSSAPYSVYPPYASRRYGSYRPYKHRPHGDDLHYKAPSERR